jgi:23S rRNA (guanine745-N1)-methyltransferase
MPARAKQPAHRIASPAALAALAPRLRCPSCGAALAAGGRALTCARGHAFDVARDDHVALLPPRAKAAPGDPPEMVAARAAFLAAGHYAPLAEAVVTAVRRAVGPGSAPTVVDLGAGTGYYLAAVLEGLGAGWGVALDASGRALRRAVRAHPRIAGVRCDVWHGIPAQAAAADVAINVFAPRNAQEVARVLRPDGAFIVVVPAPDHLHELAAPFGAVGVEPGKRARLRAELTPYFRSASRRDVRFELTLNRKDVRALMGMGPTAYHLTADEIRDRAAALPEALTVTASVTVETYRSRAQSS